MKGMSKMQGRNKDYEFNVRVKNKPVTEVVHNGKTYIEGRKNSIYELYFKNNSYKKFMIVPSVDGLSTLDGSPAGIESKGFIVYGKSEITIKGWLKDNNNAAEFIFGEQKINETYVEKLNNAGYKVDINNQGVIGLLVFEEKPYISHRIPDNYQWYGSGFEENSMWGSSPLRSNSVMCSSSSMDVTTSSTLNINSMGTKLGENVEFKTTTATFNRKDSPNETMIIYYDNLDNLKKMGVPINAFRNVMYDKNPFPASPQLKGFCPVV